MGRIEQKKIVFRSLVSNAGDFLQQSLVHLEENPKLSLIHFCTAIELFLKARLMLEHWSLIFDKPSDAELSKFTSGDFTSVNFNAALLRLNNIAQADIPQQAAQCFRSLQNHRNRLVHFSHPAYSSPASREAQEAVLAEQLRAWYYLHQLLQLRWYSEFSGVMPLISNLNQMMHRRAGFLKIKFDELANHIEKLRREGALFASCPACGFESSGHLLQLGPLQVSRCLVCSHEVKAVAAHCPACHANNLLSEIEHKQCKMCKRDITLADLLAEHGTAAGDPDVESAYCHGC